MAEIIISDAVLEDYKKTAVKWNPTLLDLPIRTADDVLKFMHGITGLRGKMKLGSVFTNSQFAPFKKDRSGEAKLNIDYREIEDFLGNAVEEFSPVDYAFLTMGYNDPIAGEKIKNASTTALILFHLAKAKGKHIAQAVLTGVRNPDGDTTLDLCDGLVTIAKNEITAGNISTSKGNLIELQDEFSMENACDLIKEEILFRLNPYLRLEDNVLLCSPHLVDQYNESYKATHIGLSYNTTYNQPYVEGSANKLTLVGIPEMEGVDHLILTQKDNMWWATDNKSDMSTVDIMRKNHYTLSMASNMFLGAQYRTIDPRRLTIVKLAQKPSIPETPSVSETGES